MLFKKLLIANRGEIACRIIRTAKELEIPTVAVYSAADESALHVRLADEAINIGSAQPAESYLNIQKIINGAKRFGVDSIHPGYGFLSENYSFAEACEQNSIEFIGPPSHAIRTMASKSLSMEIAKQAGVPILQGYRESKRNLMQLERAAKDIGFPVLLKSALGGGGRGMRIVDSEDNFEQQLQSARAESLQSFGDDNIVIEKYLTHARHVEVQIAADKFGNIIHLFDRDCSAQRRYQKIIEEAPAPNIEIVIKKRMYEAAISIASTLNYHNVGTVEFLLEGDAFYFIEMNTRLQVEHPVTEQITDCDLVEWQLRLAAGESIKSFRVPVQPLRHSVETRIYAENASKDFLPAPGMIQHLHFPELSSRLEVHTGVVEGDMVARDYDPMIAKLVSSGPSRIDAIQAMKSALFDLQIAGVPTNTAFLLELIQTEEFLSGTIDTKFVENNLNCLVRREPDLLDEIAILAALYAHSNSQFSQAKPNAEPTQGFCSPWDVASGWRFNSQPEFCIHVEYLNDISSVSLSYTASGLRVSCGPEQINCDLKEIRRQKLVAVLDGVDWRVSIIELDDKLALFHRGSCYELRIVDRLSAATTDVSNTGSLRTPLPGRVSRVLVSEGELVKAGQRLIIIEAMKMEHPLTSPTDGIVTSVNYSANDQVDEDATCLVVAPLHEH